MKPILSRPLLALAIFVAPVLPAAEKPPSPPADGKSLPASSLAGRFGGKWKSSSDASGELHITFRQDGTATWIAEAMFTFQGAEVPTKLKSLQAEGAKVQLVIDWVIDGTPGQSKLTGELKGDTLEGTYETSGQAGASRGTWNVARR